MITQAKGTARPKGHWFKSMSANMQKVYVRKHPKTRFKATASDRVAPPDAMTGEWRKHKSYHAPWANVRAMRKNLAGAGIHASKHGVLIRHHTLMRHHGRRADRHLDMMNKHAKGSRWYNYHKAKHALHTRQVSRHGFKYRKLHAKYAQ